MLVGSASQLLEREREVTILRALAADVRAGRSRLALLTGEAGIGKTRLAHDLLDDLGPTWQRIVLDGVSRATVESESPVALVCDDLRDLEDPVRFLRMMHLGEAPTLLLCAHRPGVTPHDPSDGVAMDLLRFSGSIEIPVHPLSRPATAALARTIDPDSTDHHALHRRSGGNPFFVQELVRHGDDSVPWAIRRAVTERLECIAPKTRGALEILAVARRSLPLSVVEAVLDDSVGAALHPTGLVQSRSTAGGELVRLRHGVVGSVLIDAMPVAARRSRQQQVTAQEARSATDGTSDDGVGRLTRRDRTVLSLLARGLTNRQIAVELHLSEKTVRNQLSLLFAKMGFERRAQAAVYAVRHGLDRPD